MQVLLEEKDVEINGKTFVLSKFPAIAGREIISKYPTSAIPKLGDYDVNKATMLKLMNYVGVRTPAGVIRLSSEALIDNHTGNWETLMKLEGEMMAYNCSFFQNGVASGLLKDIMAAVPEWTTKMLTGLLPQSSRKAKPRSKI